MNGIACHPTGCAKLEQLSEVLPFYTVPPPATIAMQPAIFSVPCLGSGVERSFVQGMNGTACHV